MDRDKVFELMLTAGCSKYCDPKHPELEGFIVNDSVLDRIVALIEREVRGGVEPVAWMYTLEYGDTVADRKVSLNQLNYPFGVCGADYLRENRDGISYVRQTPLYAQPVFVPNQRPVAWMCTETKIFYENDTSAVDKYHGFKPTVPIYTHPTPAVVRQLVEALDITVAAYREIIDEQGITGAVFASVARNAEAVLAAAKEAGL